MLNVWHAPVMGKSKSHAVIWFDYIKDLIW